MTAPRSDPDRALFADELRAMRKHRGWTRDELGAFVIAEVSEPPAIVYLENALDGQTVENPDIAEAMSDMFDALRMEALTGGASLNLIEEAAQRWKEQTPP